MTRERAIELYEQAREDLEEANRQRHPRWQCTLMDLLEERKQRVRRIAGYDPDEVQNEAA